MTGFASHTAQVLHGLAVAFAGHQAISLEAVSGRALNKGGFFDGLPRGRDCRTGTAERLLLWFDAFWPEDLPWPDHVIARPSGAQLPVPSPQRLADLAHEPIWSNGRRPSWWHDIEVRQFLTSAHRQMSLLQAAKIGARRFGARCPKKSSIHVYWQRLDRLPDHQGVS
jgi:hypothetical protein